MKTWCFYNKITGLFSKTRYSAIDDADLVANTPEGCTPIEGTFDFDALKFDLATGKVVEYSAGIEQKRLERQDRIARAKIKQLEEKQLRAQREHLLGDTSALSRLSNIDSEIAELRPALLKDNDR